MDNYRELRQSLHRLPEISGKEKNTAGAILAFLEKYHPDKIVTGIGGYGIVALFNGKHTGLRVMVRCELDALPIPETLDIPHRSEAKGVSHKCGHDGHMAIVAGLAEYYHLHPPEAGSVMLLFQPSEETGEGAERVLNDPKFREFLPDYVLALHNLPGYSLGEIILRPGVFASASSGLHFHLQGQTAHAAEPEKGRSPALAVAQLIQALSAIPQFHTSLHEATQVTVIQARVGEIAYGTSPGEGDVRATLRAHSQEVIDHLQEKAIELAKHTAATYGLELSVNATELFPSTKNDAEVLKIIDKSARQAGLNIHYKDIPFAWSEDFGHFTARYKGALFGLGAGENHPVLHHPDYDFPDELIELGVNIFIRVIKELQGGCYV